MKTKLVGNAHLITGGSESIPSILKLLEKEGIRAGNPDLYVRTYTHFGVNEARELSDRASLRAVGKGQRIFVIATVLMTSEAQNALLKTLESRRLMPSLYLSSHRLVRFFRHFVLVAKCSSSHTLLKRMEV